MQRAFDGKSRTFFASLLCLFAFILFIGSLTATAGSDSGAKKGCDPKACTKVCPMMMKASSQTKTQAAEADSAHLINLNDLTLVDGFTCPMHPQVKSEQPGKCPECGMKLVKANLYQAYTCNTKDCSHPCIHAQPGKCCGKELQKTLMTKDEVYQTAGLTDEYFCPMHPEVISTEAGKCPKCGMNLEMRTVQTAQVGSSAAGEDKGSAH